MIITDTHVFFYSSTQCFSNWHHSPGQLTLRGLSFDHTEGAFMYLKARFFGDHEVAALAAHEPDPRKVKALGRQVKGYDDAAWTCVREGLMAYCNLLKYAQNAAMREELISTGSRILVEASPYDRVWGVGLAENDPLILDPANWRGTNLLGAALMTVRGLLSAAAAPTAVSFIKTVDSADKALGLRPRLSS